MFVDFRIALRCTGIAFVAVLVVGITLVMPTPVRSLLQQDAASILLLALTAMSAALRGGTGRER
ncbi:hypothetical protein ABZU86_13440 [Streptomyces sp. NPDC005271]|uniref:hypothetical protein n=1 Tax=unclassified Streptomyces TaxID=2593676 RepID=UPI0033B04B7A